jgi:hypothetical protein
MTLTIDSNKMLTTGQNLFQQSITEATSCQRQALLNHPLYQRLKTIEDLASFMEHHIFAVWDFMSLLKSLQLRLTCTTLPWLPVGDGRLRRLVNEIVLGEESDCLPDGGASSHFELYLQAMNETGAKTETIEAFVQQLQSGRSLATALEESAAPPAVRAFVEHTFAVIESNRPHEIAAAFTYGREDLIPDMFTQLVHSLEQQFPGRLSTLRYYLDRHIELDGDEHGDMGRQMVDLLCNDNPQLQQEARQAAVAALQARLELWDAIAESLG